jgi:hypothetical protein
MALTATKVVADQYKITYLLTGDGAATAAIITNATLVADAAGGALKNALSSAYANTAAVQAVFGAGKVRMWVRPINDAFPVGVFGDTDAVSTTRPEINITAAVAPGAGDTAYLDIEFDHSTGR